MTNSTRDSEIPQKEVVHASVTVTQDLAATCRYAYVVGKVGEYSRDEEENLRQVKDNIPKSWKESAAQGSATCYPEGQVYLNAETGEYEVKVRVKVPKKKEKKKMEKDKSDK